MSTGVPNPTPAPAPSSSPSLLRAHAHYMKGQLNETIGHISGSDAWRGSGEMEKQEGIDQMKAANERRAEPGASAYGGKVEEVAGKAVGCRGMEGEGRVRQEKEREGAEEVEEME